MEQKAEYSIGNTDLQDALEMMGLNKPKEIKQEVSGFFPLFEAMIEHYKNVITPSVFGAVWRYCQMEDSVCKASLETIGNKLGLNKATVMRHIDTLCKDGYLIDLTPDLKNKPHIYVDARKVVMISKLSVAESNSRNKSVAQSNSSVAQSNVTVAESKLNKVFNKDSNKSLEEKDSLKKDISSKGGLSWGIALDRPSEELAGITESARILKEKTDYFEKEMGYSPLAWGSKDLEPLANFLKDKSPQEIHNFAVWSKNPYNGLNPAKARQHPKLVIDLWPQAQPKVVDDYYKPYVPEPHPEYVNLMEDK